MTRSARIFCAMVLTAAVMLWSAQSADAQGLSSGASTSAGSSCTGANNADGFCGFVTTVPTNTAATVVSRYAWNINADVGTLTTRDTSSNASHNVSFTATAPGSYQVALQSDRIGMVQRNDDLLNCNGQAHMSALSSSSNIALTTGALTHAAVDVNNGTGNQQTAVSQSANATILRLSNGVGQNHSLTFTWNGSVRSNSCEAAVRLGQQNGSTTGCGACEYTGSPSRTQATDGHFVTVTFTNFCGDGVINGTGEQCDLGGANGSGTSCCNSNCTFRSVGQVCRANSGGGCDVQETCTGANANCPADGFASATTSCRAVAGDCDVAESCTGSGPNCPADGFLSATTTCRPTAGDCDV
ncbi:MAG: hypothetical protein ACRERC_21160, partial [Candidatus Binatia bacterium]